MDTTTLVENLIEDGHRLSEQLLRDGFDVTTAFWLKGTDDVRWYLYIVSPVVETDGLAQAYGRLHPLIRRMQPPVRIDPLEVKLIGPSNPIAKDVLAIHKRPPGPNVGPIRWSGPRLGNIAVDGAYLYPVPATAPT